MTFENIEIVEEQSILKPVGDVMNEINRMISDLLSKTQHLVTGAMLTALLVGTIPQAAANSYQTISNKIEIIIDNSGKQFVAYDTASFYFHHARLFADIDRLSVLRDGWDGNFAKAPSRNALDQVSMIVKLFDEDVLAYCAIFPENNSGLYLQGRFPNGRLAVYLDGDKMTYVLKNRDHKISKSSVEIVINSIKELHTAIITLLLDENA